VAVRGLGDDGGVAGRRRPPAVLIGAGAAAGRSADTAHAAVRYLQVRCRETVASAAFIRFVAIHDGMCFFLVYGDGPRTKPCESMQKHGVAIRKVKQMQEQLLSVGFILLKRRQSRLHL